MMAINIMSKFYFYYYYAVASRVLDRLSITPASLKLHRLLVIICVHLYVRKANIDLPEVDEANSLRVPSVWVITMI